MSTAGRHMQPGRSRKKFLQRLYRSTEAENFSQLRQIIQDITQESPHTRHDILMKAAEIIKQLVTNYCSLLEEQVASTSTTSNTSSPMQHPTLVHPMSNFPPESWSIDPMSMYPFSLSNMPDSVYAPVSLSNMDNTTYNYVSTPNLNSLLVYDALSYNNIVYSGVHN
ncbi:hypothetical protein BDR04DRAFT_1232565 [Suillus decipiens]|nr:hypothetical protein BDR04DRAFT_1232565 [Suillus decipiens]